MALFWFCLSALVSHAATYHSVKVSELDFGEDSTAAKKALEKQPTWGAMGNGQVMVRCPVGCYSALEMPEGGNRWEAKQGDFELVFRIEDDGAGEWLR